MTEVSTRKGAPASAESPINWAPCIRAELEAAGLNIVQMPEHLNAEQAEAMLTEFQAQILAHKAAKA